MKATVTAGLVTIACAASVFPWWLHAHNYWMAGLMALCLITSPFIIFNAIRLELERRGCYGCEYCATVKFVIGKEW